MIHGLNNRFLYAVTQLQCICKKGSDIKQYAGTGFFVVKDEQPYLITNRHVADPGYKDPSIEGYKLVEVVFHNRNYNRQTHKVDLEECHMVIWTSQRRMLNLFVKLSDQNQTCLGYGMAKKGRMKFNLSLSWDCTIIVILLAQEMHL